MLGKLLKHEWKAVWKIPTILMVILFSISVLAGLTFAAPIWESDVTGLEILVLLMWLLFYFAIIGVSLGITLYLAIHFYKNMFTDEGYLTHTLPVTSHELLFSKIIPIMAWMAISVIGIFVSVGIFANMAVMFLKPEDVSLAQVYGKIIEEFTELDILGQAEWVKFIGSLFLLGISGVINSTMMIVGSVSIGQMVSRHKVLGSIGAYFAINTVLQTISAFFTMPFILINMNGGNKSVFDILTPTYFGMGIMAIIISVGLYFLSEYLIRRKLNLD